jgi:uncharacterized OsmC-like protein
VSNGKRPGVTVRQLDGRRLLGVSRTHSVVLDRPVEEGGADSGFTSGEMLLLAIGSCCTGSLRGYLEAQGNPIRDLEVAVQFEPGRDGAERDRIVITLKVDPRDLRGDPQRVKLAAVSGGVTSRLAQGSDVEVRFATELP